MKKSKSDIELIEEIKSNQNISENFLEILDRHSGIYHSIINKFISKKFPEKKLDFINDKEYHVFMAILEFDKTKKTKFSTYLGNKIKWMCINDYNRTIKRKTSSTDNEELDSRDLSPAPDYKINREDIKRFFQLATKDTDPRVIQIFKLRYMEGSGNKLMPWRDVCKDKKINLSIQGCINVHNRFLKKIKNKMEN